MRRLRDVLVWWGIPFAISGLVGLALSLLAGLPFIRWLVNNAVVTVSGNITQTIVTVIFGAVDYVARNYLVWVGIEFGHPRCYRPGDGGDLLLDPTVRGDPGRGVGKGQISDFIPKVDDGRGTNSNS